MHNSHFPNNVEVRELVADLLSGLPSRHHQPSVSARRDKFGLGWQRTQAWRVTMINEKPIELIPFPFSKDRLTSHNVRSVDDFCHNNSWKVVPVFQQWLSFLPIYWLFNLQNILNKYATKGDMTSFWFQVKSCSPILFDVHLLVQARHMEQIWTECHVWINPKYSALHMNARWKK